jgi:TolB-like protein
MRSWIKTRYSILLALVLLPFLISVPQTVLSQQRVSVVVFEPQAIGVDQATVMATCQLLRNDLAATGKFSVVDEGKMRRLLGELSNCYDSQCASELGQRLSADKAVVGSLSRLGQKIIVELRLVDVASAQVEFSDRIASATVEDLDTVIKRLATGLATGKTWDETAEIGTIIEQETHQPRRRKSFFSVGGKIGYMFPTGNSWGKADKLLALDWVTWYETPSFMVESLVGYRYQVNEDKGAYDVPIEFSVFYIPGKSDFTPYLGGGLGIHWIGIPEWDSMGENWDQVTSNGLALNLGGGLMGFRTYDFRLVVDLRYTMVFAQLGDQDSHQAISLTFGVTSPRKGAGGPRGCCIFNY